MPPAQESRAVIVLGAAVTTRAGGLDLLIRTDAGYGTFRFPDSVALGVLVRPPVERREAPARVVAPRPALVPDRRELPAERRALYLATYVDWRRGRDSLDAVAARHGLNRPALEAWFRNHLQECAAALAGERAPVAKPSGGIL